MKPDWFLRFHCRTFRSSRPEMFCEEEVPKNFAWFTGKYLSWSLSLKLDCHLPKKLVLFTWLKALEKRWKVLFISSFYTFYTLFVLKIFKFLSQLFGHVGKTAWLISKFMTSQPGLQTIAIHILPNISQSKGNQTIKFGQLIQYNKRNIFLQKLCRKWGK